MTSAAYPTVYAAVLAAVTTAASTCRVVDGYDVSDDPGNVIMLGVPDIRDQSSIAAGTFNQTVATLGASRPREEEGTINGLIWGWNGNGNASAARTTAFGFLASIEAALRTDPALGVTAFQRLVVELRSGDVLEDKEDGANCALPITFAYTARI